MQTFLRNTTLVTTTILTYLSLESQRSLSTLGVLLTLRPCCRGFPNAVELTDALGLETTPCEVGQTRARNGALQQVALPAAEEHAAADLFGGDVDEWVMSRCGQLASVYYNIT